MLFVFKRKPDASAFVESNVEMREGVFLTQSHGFGNSLVAYGRGKITKKTFSSTVRDCGKLLFAINYLSLAFHP